MNAGRIHYLKIEALLSPLRPRTNPPRPLQLPKKVQNGPVMKKAFKPAIQKPQNTGKRGFQGGKPRFNSEKTKKNIADRLSVNLADRLTCAPRKK
ncbi:hypothetical protein L596_020177 [Steinernema carpocapsae]|uniref:Uncharacterized protein n=1 Tax=Steinernema carpocapsae TaxID=34508 RepID=A0A4U5MTJ7_STECR|nr:hypothetical protein L596_020177 [Steinernema carpocapsae]